MANKKPEDMSDEMWAAVCIVMEDHQIKSFKDMTDSHQAVIERMDQMENKWAETQAATDTEKGAGGDAGAEGSGVPDGPVSGGEGSPPPIVEGSGGSGSGGGDDPKGSGRGGKPRWYERDGYAK